MPLTGSTTSDPSVGTSSLSIKVWELTAEQLSVDDVMGSNTQLYVCDGVIIEYVCVIRYLLGIIKLWSIQWGCSWVIFSLRVPSQGGRAIYSCLITGVGEYLAEQILDFQALAIHRG